MPGPPVYLLTQTAPGRCRDTHHCSKATCVCGMLLGVCMAASCNHSVPKLYLQHAPLLVCAPTHPSCCLCHGAQSSCCPEEQLEPRPGLSPPSRSAMVASRRLVLPSAAAASSHCRRRMGYSLPVSACRTLELVMSTARLASVSGTGTVSRDLRQELSAGCVPTPPGLLQPSGDPGEASSCLHRYQVQLV